MASLDTHHDSTIVSLIVWYARNVPYSHGKASMTTTSSNHPLLGLRMINLNTACSIVFSTLYPGRGGSAVLLISAGDVQEPTTMATLAASIDCIEKRLTSLAKVPWLGFWLAG
jgi:hypothetical protein